LLFSVFVLGVLLPTDGCLPNSADGDILHSPFTSSIVTLFFVSAALVGIAYGIGSESIKSDADI
jgi:aminobenzoyl-glutamate transport protein